MMKQPPFWLKVSNKYVIENFEQLLKYVKAYIYEKEEESEDGDFGQTYKYLKAVADDYAIEIRKLRVFQTPQFDVSVEKVVRIICTAILTGKKMGIDDFQLLTALINLLILNNKHIGADIEREYFRIIKNCIARRPINCFMFSWNDLDCSQFMIGLIESKLSKTEFVESLPATVYIYENRGCLVLKDEMLVLSSMNYNDYKMRKMKPEFRTDFGIEVKSENPVTDGSIDKLLEVYPYISGEFDDMKPSHLLLQKTYSDSETIIVRIRQKSGIKVEVETIDPEYIYERGNVFLDSQIGLIPKSYFLESLSVGDYLPVVRNQHDHLPFRIDLRRVGEFISDYVQTCIENGQDVLAMKSEDIKGGARWITELGLSVNIFDGDGVEEEVRDDWRVAQDMGLLSIIRIHSKLMDSKSNCLVKGRFIEIASSYEEEIIDFMTIDQFKQQAYSAFIDEFKKNIYANRPYKESTDVIEQMTDDTVHLLGVLTYQLAMKQNSGDSAMRVEELIVAMLVMRMVDISEESDFVRAQLDYQKAVILFAKGVTPTALPCLQHVNTELDEMVECLKIVDVIRQYKEYTDISAKLHTSLIAEKDSSTTYNIVRELVKASNSLLYKIDKSEINRIKKTICGHLNVMDQYVDIYDKSTNYGVESDFLEFKVSCVLPPNEIRSSSILRDMEFQKWTILKAVCAFLNSMSGGELLIGVADSGFAVGIQNDIDILFHERIISEPTADRLRTYIKLFIDRGFVTCDKKVSGTAITAGRVQCIIEQNSENCEIIRIRVAPYPWDVVKISYQDRPSGFHDVYIRTSGASTPMTNSGVRDVKLRKMKAIDKGHYKIARILQAIDDKVVVEISNYSGADGISKRRLEPYKIFNNKAFLAYDIVKRDMRMFKFSRFRGSDLKLTSEKWKYQKRHINRNLDIFGMIETEDFQKTNLKLKLTDYARNLLIEECECEYSEDNIVLRMISNNNEPDNYYYPWALDVEVNSFVGIGRFVLGLPGHIKMTDSEEFTEYLKSQIKSLC